MESGNLINSFSFTDKPTDAILRLGNALGYGTQDVGAIVAKLKNEDNEKIIMANRLLGLNDVTINIFYFILYDKNELFFFSRF